MQDVLGGFTVDSNMVKPHVGWGRPSEKIQKLRGRRWVDSRCLNPCVISCSIGKWTSIKVSINSSQLRAGKEKPRQERYFSLVLDGVGMQARRANYAS